MIRAFAGLVVATLVVTTAVLAAPSPQSAWVDTGVDLDTSGNGPLTVGAIDDCLSVEPGAAFDIDVWVRDIPEYDPVTHEGGISGIAYNLIFDPAVVNVIEVNNDYMIVASGGDHPFSWIDADATGGAEQDPLPATTGNARIEFAGLGTNRESGSGVTNRITLKAIGAGASNLVLQDDLYPFPAPHIVQGDGRSHFVNTVTNGRVVVGASCEAQEIPTPVDVGGLGGTIPGGATPPPNSPPGAGGTGQPSGNGGSGTSRTQPAATNKPSDGGVTFTEGETAIAVDVVPSENEATVIGEVETCASASAGDQFIIDLVINDAEDLLAFEASVNYDGSMLDIIDRDVKLFLESSEGSQVVDTSKQTPDGSGQYTTGGVDTADPLSPETGSGVLVRLTLEAKAEGTSEISLAGIDQNSDGKDDRGVFLRNVDGDIIGDDDEDTFFDGPVASAAIVVGEPCEDSDAKVVAASGGEGSGEDDGGNDALPFVVGGAIAFGLIAIAGAGYLAYRRRRESGLASGAPTNEPPSGETPL